MAEGKLIRLGKVFFRQKIGFFLLLNLFFLFFLTIVLGLSFRKIRDSLPPPEIGTQKIIGYIHYFGYPFHLDTVIFFLVILPPLLIGLLVRLKVKNKI